MADFPALPLWTDAYLSDTRHLTQAQHGAYLLLLITAWRTPDCSLPNDDILLSRYACADMRTWLKQKKSVMAFWTLGEDGRWRQKKLTSVRAFLVQRACNRAEAGRRGGCASAAAKSLKEQEAPQANVNDYSSKTQASKTKTKSNLPEEDKSSSAAGAPRTLEQQVFDLGREVIPGKNSGGQVTRLKRHFDGDLERTLQALRVAAAKSDPPSYIGAILRGDPAARADNFVAETDLLYQQWGVS